VLFGIFPIVLAVVILGAKKKGMIALTNRRIILYKQTAAVVIFPYEEVVSIENRVNWLHFMRELLIRRKTSKEFSPTTISRQSGIKQEFIDGFSATDLGQIEQVIKGKSHLL